MRRNRLVWTLGYVGYGLALLAVLRGHAQLHQRVLVGLLLGGYVIPPLVTFLHELAHGCWSVALSGQRVLIEIGHQPAAVRFALGRIDVRWDPRPGRAHCVLLPDRISRPRMIAIVLAGPVSTALAGGAFLWAATSQRSPLTVLGVACWTAVLHCAMSVVVNLVPATHTVPWLGGAELAKRSNDGMLIWRALRGHRGRELWNPELRGAPPRAPQRRLPPLTTRAAGVLGHAFAEASALGADHVGTDHLLCGLAHGDPETAELLTRRGVHVPCGITGEPRLPTSPSPPTPRLRRVYERAAANLSLSGVTEVAPEHLLLALLADGDCSAAAALSAREDTVAGLRADVVGRLTKPMAA
ncbi:MAG: hypothetical protein QOK25_2547 [Thermoleophilaceae bacterium]|nr:hypothetical protein [Thermoleophilaceae bacterium]